MKSVLGRAEAFSLLASQHSYPWTGVKCLRLLSVCSNSLDDRWWAWQILFLISVAPNQNIKDAIIFFLQVMRFPIRVLLVVFFFYFCSSRYATTTTKKIKSVLDYYFHSAQQGFRFLGNIWAGLMVSDKVINVAGDLLWQLLCTLFNHLHHGLSFLISLFHFCLFGLDRVMPDKYPFPDIPLVFFFIFLFSVLQI